MSTQKRPRHRPSPTPAAQNVVTFIALSYLGIFLINLLTKSPEVGKAMANPNEKILFAFDAPSYYNPPSLSCCILVQSGCVRVYARSPVCRRNLCFEFGRRTVRCSLQGKSCRQQEVNSSGAFRQIFGLQGVTVLFGASGGCAAGGPGSSK